MQENKLEEILDDIKRLTILGLIKQGVKSNEIAKALDVDPAVVTRLVSLRKKTRKK